MGTSKGQFIVIANFRGDDLSGSRAPLSPQDAYGRERLNDVRFDAQALFPRLAGGVTDRPPQPIAVGGMRGALGSHHGTGAHFPEGRL